MKLTHPKKKLLLALFIPLLFVFAYWFKNLVGINFFDSLSLSAYPPFKYLTESTITSPKPGILLEDDFNTRKFFRQWSGIWMHESGTVTAESAVEGIGGSKCLLVKNNGSGSWVYSHRKRVKVQKGDVFSFEGFADIRGDSISAWFSIAALDQNKKAVSWNLFKETITRTGEWVRVNKTFTIPDDEIRYINFRIVGKGNGEFRFDNIVFRKLKF